MRPRRPIAAVVLAAALLACDGGEGEPEIPRPACPDQVNATFELRQPGASFLSATGVYWDAPAEEMFPSTVDGCVTRIINIGDDPPDPRDLLDVGILLFTGPGFELAVSPTAFNEYATAGSDPSFAPGDPVTVSGAGGDTGVDPFEITARVVPDMTVPASTLSVPSDGDLELTWDPADSPPGTRVEFAARSEYGLDYTEFLSCWSDDTGAMTIPAGDFNKLRPGAGDPLHASLERVHSAAVETEHGCGRFEIRSAAPLEIQAE
jgi:hypothetical protein